MAGMQLKFITETNLRLKNRFVFALTWDCFVQRDRGPYDPLFESRTRSDFTPLPQQAIGYGQGGPVLQPGFVPAAITGPDHSKLAITNAANLPAGYLDPQIQKGISSGKIMNAPADQPGNLKGQQLAITGQLHQAPAIKPTPQILNDIQSDKQRLQQGLIEKGGDTLVQKSLPISRVAQSDSLQLATARGASGHHRRDASLSEDKSYEVKTTESKGSKHQDEIRDTNKIQRRKQQEQEQKQKHQQLHDKKRQKHLGMTFEELRDIFKKLDVNDDHSITHREFIRGLKTHRSIAAKLGM